MARVKVGSAHEDGDMRRVIFNLKEGLAVVVRVEGGSDLMTVVNMKGGSDVCGYRWWWWLR